MNVFKVGQRVWDAVVGWCFVVDVDSRAAFTDSILIHVQTDMNRHYYFTEEGKHTIFSDASIARTLFFDEIKPSSDHLKPRFVPDFVKGSIALINDVKMDRKFIRVIAEDQRHEDRIDCYSDGNISGDEREWFERGPAWLFTKINNK